MKFAACIGGVAWLLVAVPAAADELWVDHDSLGGPCDDSRARTEISEAAPWCTLATAAQNVAPGDTVHVRGGTYTEVQTCLECDDNSVLQIVTPGTSNDWIRFAAEPNEEVVLSAAGGAEHGIRIRHGAQPWYVEIVGFQITGFTSGDCVGVGDSTDRDGASRCIAATTERSATTPAGRTAAAMGPASCTCWAITAPSTTTSYSPGTGGSR